MSKVFLLSLIMISLTCRVDAQKMQTNYGVVDSTHHSLAYKILHDKYDNVIAYTTEGYWQSNRISYVFIGVKGKMYSKGSIHLKRDKDHTWSKPVVKQKKVNSDKGAYIFMELDKMGLWKLNVDSLNNQNEKNQDGSINKITLFDATNYRFELINGDNYLPIEAYAPEQFLEELPQYKQREPFIKIRDRFLQDYKAL